MPIRVPLRSAGSSSANRMPLWPLLPLCFSEHSVSRRHLFFCNRCRTMLASLVIQPATHAHASGQTSENACFPCSSSQSCPPGSSVPTQSAQVTTAQIVSYVCSAIASVVGVMVGIFKIYPFIKARVVKLNEAGIKPTLKRIIFLQNTLSKYQPLLSPVDFTSNAVSGSCSTSMGMFSRDFVASVSSSSAPSAQTAHVVSGTVTSVPILSQAPPALLRLTAEQLGCAVKHLPASFYHRAHLTLA
jgi:hypothetical protein